MAVETETHKDMAQEDTGGTPIIEVRGLEKRFPVKSGPMARTEWLRAVGGVDFSVGRDTVFAIVGESGCGKSTVARLLLKLLERLCKTSSPPRFRV